MHFFDIFKLWLFFQTNDKFTLWQFDYSIHSKEVSSIKKKKEKSNHIFVSKFLSPNIYKLSISDMLQRYVVHSHAHSFLGYIVSVVTILCLSLL